MGVVSPTIGLTKKAAESLEALKASLGNDIGVELLLDTDNPNFGRLAVRYPSVEIAQKDLDRLRAAIASSGFKHDGELPVLTGKLDPD